nr:hypothetical protein [Novosphingobium panipatense]
MDVIVSRTRIAGCAPLYSYRALVPLEGVAPDRRHRVAVLHVQTVTIRAACTRIADTIAPHRWFEQDMAVSFGLAAQLGLAARRIEVLLLQSVFPEMTTWLAPIALRLDHDPGSASYRVATIDLNAAFDAIAPHIDTLTAAELAPPRFTDRRVT